MKYCKISGVTKWSGGVIVLREGMTADDDHPLVAERPDLWRDEDVSAVDLPTVRQPGHVERATAAPGERRGSTSRVPKGGSGQ